VPPVYTIDEPLVEVVLGKIWERYCSGAYPYNLAADSLPQNYLPESLPRGGIEEAYYWVIVCLWMRTTNTTTAAKQVAKLYDHLAKKTCLNPFNPFNAAQMKPPRIATLMKEVGLGLDDSSPEWWVENARRVVERWDGDVRRPFMGATSYDEVWPRLINAKDEQQGGLLGFQHKMTCMLLYFLSEHGIIEPFPFPPPIDFQLMRIAAETELVRRNDGSKIIAGTPSEFEALEELLRLAYFGYELKYGLEGNRFADALWLHSRHLCRNNPGNASRVALLDHKGGKGRKREVTPHVVDWSGNDLDKYERACGSCAIEEHCRHNVASASRYIQGRLEVRSLRQRPPVATLFPGHIGRPSAP
jgi:hypothetical protein